jgi:hypothetical protein
MSLGSPSQTRLAVRFRFSVSAITATPVGSFYLLPMRLELVAFFRFALISVLHRTPPRNHRLSCENEEVRPHGRTSWPFPHIAVQATGIHR